MGLMSGTRLQLLAIILGMLTLLSAGCSSAQAPPVTPSEEVEQPVLQAGLVLRHSVVTGEVGSKPLISIFLRET